MAWLRDLQWQEHEGSVSFLELAPDFEAHSGRAMPAAQGHDLQGISLSLHERGRVLRSARAVLEKHVGWWQVCRGWWRQDPWWRAAAPWCPLGRD